MTDLATAPPHNVEVEQALLGAILINNDAFGVVAGEMEPDYFYEPTHGAIFSAAATAIAAGKKATPVTLKDYLPPGTFGELNIPIYLARLTAEATTIINVPDFASHIRELWELRQIALIGRDAGTPGEAPALALESAWAALDHIRARAAKNTAECASLGVFAKLVAEEVACAPVQGEETVPSSGFSALDSFIGGGYRPGRLIVCAGRPGMGKTVFGAASARRVAIKGYGVAFFSLEIDGRELSARMMSADLSFDQNQVVPYSDILANNLTMHARTRVAAAADRLASLPLEIDACGGLSMFEIAARARIYVDRWRQRGIKPGLVVIDYLGLVSPSDRYRGRKVDEQGEIAKAGKDLAKRLGVCVLMLSQLNRGVEHRDDKRPTMADLRDSGNIEEHADIVALLYRPAYYDERNPEIRDGDIDALSCADARKFDLEVGLGKNRLGPTSTVTLWCNVAASLVDSARRV